MSMFGNLSAGNATEEVKDVLGGGGFTVESDEYKLKIKALYGGKSDKGAMFVQLIGEREDGKEYKETLYVTNQKGENFYVDKKDEKKRHLLPGFVTANDICLCATGKELSEVEMEEKVVKVYDAEAKGEVPKNVPMIVDAIGQTISVLILKSKENKTVKQGNEYVPTAETREVNSIEKVFDTDTRFTVVEAKSGAEQPIYVAAWLEKNKGKTRDKTSKNVQAGTAGAPPKASGNTPPPAAGGARPSLFGKK